MSFLGKLLIAFQLVLSIVFLAFAGAVFSTQQNWKTLAETNEKNLKTEQAAHQNDLQADQLAKANLQQELKNELMNASVAAGSAKLLEDDVTSLKKELVAAMYDAIKHGKVHTLRVRGVGHRRNRVHR